MQTVIVILIILLAVAYAINLVFKTRNQANKHKNDCSQNHCYGCTECENDNNKR